MLHTVGFIGKLHWEKQDFERRNIYLAKALCRKVQYFTRLIKADIQTDLTYTHGYLSQKVSLNAL